MKFGEQYILEMLFIFHFKTVVILCIFQNAEC